MKRILLWTLISAGLVLGNVGVDATHQLQRVSTVLEGGNEVPVVSSPAKGQFLAVVDRQGGTVEYWMSFDRLQAPITQSHIHFAQPNVNGGIMVWLCGTPTNPGPTGGPAAQPCPPSGIVSGVITETDVIAVTPQGIAAGEFDEFADALLSGLAYANIHTSQSPGGEIRGQITLVRRTFGR